ncbi:hypothetical protein LZ30DRAFT_437581 [Colletotrichum cereale]|nr:hypothetical protein LZ30DRAFT_437581 [Colletotrichum cereale]
MLEGCAIFSCDRTSSSLLEKTPLETTPDAGIPPACHSQTRQQIQANETDTAIFGAGSGLEGHHLAVVRYDRSFFSSTRLIARPDRWIAPIISSQSGHKGSPPSRTDTCTAVQLVYHIGPPACVLSCGCDGRHGMLFGWASQNLVSRDASFERYI